MGRASLYFTYIQGSSILRILLVRKSYIVAILTTMGTLATRHYIPGKPGVMCTYKSSTGGSCRVN